MLAKGSSTIPFFIEKPIGSFLDEGKTLRAKGNLILKLSADGCFWSYNKKEERGLVLVKAVLLADFHHKEDYEGYDYEGYQRHQKVANSEDLSLIIRRRISGNV